MSLEVATVDYLDPQAPERFVASLRDSGFAVLVHHPVPAEVVTRVQAEWLEWFGTDAKWDYVPAGGAQDGYTPQTSSETAVGADVADVKEFFHWYPWGRHPTGLSDAAARLHRAGSDLAATLLGWVQKHSPPEAAAAYSMPLPQMLEGSRRTLLRILHYPPLTGAEPPGALRAAEHEDINLLTVLPAATRPGLQVLDANGGWHDVPCDPGSVVINCGDMLQMASGGWFPSTTHRVVLPEGAEAAEPRVATPLFLHAADDVSLGSTTAFEFLSDRLRRIRGIDLDKAPAPDRPGLW